MNTDMYIHIGIRIIFNQKKNYKALKTPWITVHTIYAVYFVCTVIIKPYFLWL